MLNHSVSKAPTEGRSASSWQPVPRMGIHERMTPLRITGIYLATGLSWVCLTDRALVWIGIQSEHGFLAAAGKGIVFILASALLLYWLIRRDFLRIEQTSALLRAVSDGTTDAVFVKDRAGKYLLFNDAAARFVGKPVEEVLGKDDTALFDPASAQLVMTRDQKVMAAGQAETDEEELAIGGVTRTYLATKAPYRDARGNIIGVIGVSREISVWKAAREALQEQEAFVRGILDSVPAHLAVLDPSGTILAVNESWRAFAQQNPASTGPAVRTEIGTNYLEVCADSARQGCMDAEVVAIGIQQVLDGNSDHFEMEYPCHAPEEERWYLMSVTPLTSTKRGVIVAHTNITDRKRSEERVRSAQATAERNLARLQAVVNNLADGVIIADNEGNLAEWNPAALRMSGFSTVEEVRRNFATFAEIIDFLTPEGVLLPMSEWPVPRLMRGERINEQELVVVHKHNGERLVLRCNGVRVAGTNLEPDLLILTLHDITERRRAEDELRASEERFRILVDHASDGFFLHDATGRVLDVNQQACASLGYSRDELIGMMPAQFDTTVTPESGAELAARLRTGITLAFDSWHRRKDGTTFPVEVRLRPFVTNGRGYGVALVHDITDRKQAEERLRASERRYRELADAIPQIVWTASPDGGLTHLNARATEFTGLGMEELTHWSWERVIHPDDRAHTSEQWLKVVRTGEPCAIECRIRRFDDQFRWHMIRQVPSRDATGAVQLWHGTCTDIEDLKRASEALQNEQTLLRTLIDSLPDLIFTKDMGGCFQICNRALLTFTGAATEADLVGKTVFDFFPPEQARLYQEDDNRVLQYGETISDREELARDATGQDTWRQVIKAPLRDHAGRIIGLVGVSRNIQKRKEREQLIAESQQRLSMALSAARMGVWEWDVPMGRIFWSPECLEIFGRTQTGHHLSDFTTLVHPDDIDPLLTTAQEALARHTEFVHEFRILHSGGTIRWLINQGRGVYDAQQQPIRLIGTVQDITERKQTEDATRESRTMLRLVLDNIPQGVFWKDRDSRYLGCNQVVARAMGIADPSAIIGRMNGELPSITPEEAEFFRQKDLEVMEADVAQYHIIETITLADGRTIWLDTNKVPMHDASGQVVGILGTWEDITERRLAEEALRASEARLRLFLEHVPAPIAMLDRHMRYLHVSRRWLRDYSIKEEDVTGLSHYEVFPEVPDRWKEIHQRCLAGATERNDEDRFLRKDGHLQWIRWEILPWQQADNSIGGIIIFSEDITERKRAESEQHKLVKLIEHSREFIALADLEGQLTFMNSSARQMIGLGRESDLQSVHFTDYVPEDWQEYFRNTVLATALEKGAWEGEMQLRNLRTGVTFDVYRSIFLIHDDVTDARWFATVTRDITEQKQATALLRESEERYRRLVDVLPAPVFIHADNKIVFCNPAFVRLMGAVNAEVLLGRSPFDVAHPDYHDLVRQRMARMVESGQAVPGIELHVVRLDGRTVPAYSVSTPIFDRGRSAYLVALSDLTERERSMELLHAVLGSVSDAIITIDTRGIIQSVNPATTHYFGYAENELVGRNVKLLMPEPYRAEHDNYIANLLITGVPKVIGLGREVQGLRRDGTTVPLELTVSEFRLEGERRFTGVLRDISARKRLEEQFQQAQKMEAVGRLAGGVAHDFNNLLTVINGYSEILTMNLGQGTPFRDYVMAIREAGERAARLTQQLLAFSRKAIIEPKLLDLNDLVTSSAKLLRRLIGEDIAFVVMPAPSMRLIKADPGQLEQVIMNLVVNARDAMPTGGRLTIEIREVVLGDQEVLSYTDLKPGPYAQLIVTDSGHGMSEDVRNKIFEPFFTTKGVGKGTGLGLAVVHGVVKQCGGHISVESTVGVGTSFRLLFPIAEEAITEAAEVASQHSTAGKETILLVEDEQEVRNIACLALEMQGFKVLTAECGPDALDLVAEYPDEIHMLVTDVVMPKMGGRQLAEAMRSRRPQIRILYMSGYTDDSVIRHGVVEATDAFLQKPFTPLELARKVRAMLDDSAG